jgi:hypothetical protein
MKIGDLVMLDPCRPNVSLHDKHNPTGIIFRIDEDYYGSGNAFKIYKAVARGKTIRSHMVDGIGPTHRGKRHRILILWGMEQWGYEESDQLLVVE